MYQRTQEECFTAPLCKRHFLFLVQRDANAAPQRFSSFVLPATPRPANTTANTGLAHNILLCFTENGRFQCGLIIPHWLPVRNCFAKNAPPAQTKSGRLIKGGPIINSLVPTAKTQGIFYRRSQTVRLSTCRPSTGRLPALRALFQGYPQPGSRWSTPFRQPKKRSAVHCG